MASLSPYGLPTVQKHARLTTRTTRRRLLSLDLRYTESKRETFHDMGGAVAGIGVRFPGRPREEGGRVAFCVELACSVFRGLLQVLRFPRTVQDLVNNPREGHLKCQP